MEYVTYSKLCKLYYHLQIVDAKKKKRKEKEVCALGILMHGLYDIAYFFASIVIFFFFKARRWAELICGLYLTYFGRSKLGIKI